MFKSTTAEQSSIFFFAVYSAVISYTVFWHWNDVKLGFRSLWNKLTKKTEHNAFKDVHTRLMETYREVPEWWYLILNVRIILTPQ